MHCFLSIPCHSRAFPKTQHDQSQGSARFLPPGFSAVPEIQLLSAAAFLLAYPAAFLGNISIVAAVTLDARLHTPMYSFLKHLSLVDICSVSTTLPWAPVATLLGSGQISLHVYMSQLCLCLPGVRRAFSHHLHGLTIVWPPTGPWCTGQP